MDNFALFICGIVVTLIAGMGVITSQVFLGYFKYLETERLRQLKKAQAHILKLQQQIQGHLRAHFWVMVIFSIFEIFSEGVNQ